MTRRLWPWLFSPLLVVVVACEGRPRSGAAGSASNDHGTGPAIAVFDLSDGVPEHATGGLLGLSSKAATLEDLVQQARRLGTEGQNKEVRGVLVKLGTATMGLARASEVAAMLATLGGRRPIWCHADDLGNASLFLAAQGCKRIWVSPASGVDAIGLAAQTLYFHKLLSDELGLDVDFLQVGKFKGAEEPFTRDGPSPEARHSLQSTLTDLRSVWLDGIVAGRPQALPAAFEDGPYASRDAKARGLIDDVGYFDEARDALEKATGAVRAEIRLGAGAASAGTDDWADAFRAMTGDSFGAAPIVIVPAQGAISLDGGGVLGGDGGIVAKKMLRVLGRLEKDDDVKAVVLRIDSPGGSALASDLLWHELMRLRAKKTLVVSIGDMAASGGYYLASTGTTVFADAMSVVGSIGVVGGKVAAGRALDRIGVHAETFAAKDGDSEGGAAARAGYESPLISWDDATRARVLSTMTEIYQLFLARVAEGRGIPVQRVAASAEGRIFSGKEGKERGLVDVLGGLREAIEKARALSSLPSDARVGIAGEPLSILQALMADEGVGAGAPYRSTSAARMDAVQVIGNVAGWAAPALAPFVSSVAPLAGGENVVCALPFALTVR